MFTYLLGAGGSSTTGVDWATLITSETLAPLTDAIEAVLPVVLPVSVGIVAIRKGVSFVLGMIRSA